MAIDASLSYPVEAPEVEKFAKSLRFIEEMTKNTGKVQERVLREILVQNMETEYLERFNLGGSTDRNMFKSRVPVITYEDIQPEIQRIANGDRSPILSSYPISEFLTRHNSTLKTRLQVRGLSSLIRPSKTFSLSDVGYPNINEFDLSSGTSAGERKLMPTIPQEMDRRQLLYSLLMPVMNRYVPNLDKGKGLYFLFVKAETKTPGGLLARPVLTSYYKSDHFKTRPYDPYNVYTSPDEAILCPDSFQSMYTQMLCGLLMRMDVLRVGAVFASGLLRAIRFLQLNWPQLARDILTGSLNPKITDPAIRDRMARILDPNPDLANFIVRECKGENWERIIPRIWPNTKYLDVIVTGAMAQYIPLLNFYSGNLPQACTMYASSECYFGLNLSPMAKPWDVSYTIMPNMGYFEFIPHGPSPLPPVDLAEVEVGKEYELVVTTYSGLCRYRVGDILRVTGFHNSAPQFKFIRRKNVLLSIDADKTDESELQEAVENAAVLLREFNTTVVEYTSFADTDTIPGHYVIYWELHESNGAPSDDVLEKCCLAMEESMNSVYRQCRVADNSVGPLEIRVVRKGTFEELMDYAISRGASINQYKAPRCVSFTPIVELLNARVMSAHFSPAAPHWAPERRV